MSMTNCLDQGQDTLSHLHHWRCSKRECCDPEKSDLNLKLNLTGKLILQELDHVNSRSPF